MKLYRDPIEYEGRYPILVGENLTEIEVEEMIDQLMEEFGLEEKEFYVT